MHRGGDGGLPARDRSRSVGDAMLVCPDDEGGAIDASTFPTTTAPATCSGRTTATAAGWTPGCTLAPLSADGLAWPAAHPPDQAGPRVGGQPGRGAHPGEAGRHLHAALLVQRLRRRPVQDRLRHRRAVTGPFTKGEEPLFTTDATDGRYVGPGGQDVVTAPDGRRRVRVPRLGSRLPRAQGLHAAARVG